MAHVTVPDLPPRQTLISTGGTDFPFSFSFFSIEDLLVYRENVLQAETTDYTVDTTGTAKDKGFEGGTIVFNSAVTSGDEITIVRDIPVERLTDFPLAGPFDIEELNTELDKIIAMIQERESNESRLRTIGLDPSDPDADLTLCLLDERKNKYLAFDANGDVICLSGTASDPSGVRQDGAVTPGNIAQWKASQLIEDGGIPTSEIYTVSNPPPVQDISGKMDLVDPVAEAGNAMVMDATGQAHDAGVPLMTVIYEKLGPVNLNQTTLTQINHSLGVIPQLVTVILTCITDDVGFLAGEKVFANNSVSDEDEGSGAQIGGLLVMPSSTDIRWRRSDEPYAIISKSSVGANLTSSRWEVEFHLVAFTGVVPAP